MYATKVMHLCMRISTAICKPPCANGGKCVSPGKCICGRGWSGPRCTTGMLLFSVLYSIFVECTYKVCVHVLCMSVYYLGIFCPL